MLKPSFEHLSHAGRMVLLLFVILICLLISSLSGLLAGMIFWGTDIIALLTTADVNNLNYIAAAKFTQIISHLGIFAISALLFASVNSANTWIYLGLDQKPKIQATIVTIVLIFVVSPWIGYVYDINQAMQLPDFLAGVQQWMKNSEETATRLTEGFLNNPSVGGFIINILMIGIVPAIGEELLFRGVIQKLFGQWTGNIHIAIIISALLFSAMHLQFFGFFPRFALGLLFGYLFYWTGSLWLPILAHFINNTMAVVVAYFYEQGLTATNAEDFGKTDNLFFVVLSVVITAALCFFLYRQRSITDPG
jgi:membrane protease YdiL (CAAX protease family)